LWLYALPPYIKATQSEKKLKKSIRQFYAREEGSAGGSNCRIAFYKRTFAKLKQKGVQIEKITLHVGLGHLPN
jgi:S-adenosylmethionine:tRNA ribosyltransferase-isomerase